MAAGLPTEFQVVRAGDTSSLRCPFARILSIEHRQRPVCERFVIEYEDIRNRLHLCRRSPFDLIHQRRQADDGVVFEQKRGNRDLTRRGAQKIGKCRPLPVDPASFRWPAQFPQNRGRIEDVSAWSIRPFAVNQSSTVHILEIAKRRARGIEHVHS
jgi:hypothetical protein